MKFIELIKETLRPLDNFTIFKTPLTEYVIFGAVFLILFLIFSLFKRSVLRRVRKAAKRTDTIIDDTLISTIKNIKLFFYIVLSLFIASKFAKLNPGIEKIITSVFIITVIYETVVFIQNVGVYFIKKFWEMNSGDEEDTTNAVNGLSLILKIVLWSVGFLLVLTNLGFEISALVASLGISSIAVAFALQNILADIFSSFSIYLDTPFKVNDFIIVGTDMGVVKKIGIKTTRLLTLQGEELIISNHELTSTRIRNFKQMEKRRIVFHIGVIYNTPAEKLKLIPGFIKEIIETMEGVTFDRSHFQKFGDFSLDFETVYYVDNGDYMIYMDKQQEINLKIFEKFETEGIEFAFPTQSIYLEKNA